MSDWATISGSDAMNRDFTIAFRSRTEIIQPIAFFLLAIVLFALGMGTSDSSLAGLQGIGVIWVTALFANMLALELVFQRDHENGTLELFLIYRNPLFLGVLSKSLTFWSLTGLPICIMAPLAAWMFQIPVENWWILVGSLLLGTPILTLLGALGSALTLGLGKGGILLALLIMPLYVPVLLLGSGMCIADALGESVGGPLMWLLVMLVASITVLPFAISASLKAAQEY